MENNHLEPAYLDKVFEYLTFRYSKPIYLKSLQDKQKFVNAVKYLMDCKLLGEFYFTNDYSFLKRNAILKLEWPNTNFYTRVS